MFCNFDIFSLMFMEMQRIKGFVLGKLNNVSGLNSFSAEVIEGKKRKDCFLFGNCRSCFLWLVWNVGGKGLCTNATEFSDVHV